MWKNVPVVCAAAGVLACVAIQTTPAEASRAQCRQEAKARFPNDAKMRHEFRRYCIREWKAWRASQRGPV
jgi:hypothetical protein